jgi:hypothetical protein
MEERKNSSAWRGALVAVSLALTLSSASAQTNPPGGKLKGSTKTPTSTPTPVDRNAKFGLPTRPNIHVNRGSTGVGLGTLLPDPSALEGANQSEVVLPNTRTVDDFAATGHFVYYPSDTQRLMLTGTAGPDMGNLDFEYSFLSGKDPGVWTIAASETRAIPGSFYDDQNDKLPGGKQPWLYKDAVGTEYTWPLTNTCRVAASFNYETNSIHSGLFTGTVAPVDQLGYPMTVSSSGVDHELLQRVAGLDLDVDDRYYPTSGRKIRFGVDHGTGLGTDFDFTRFMFQYTQFLPVNILPFASGKQWFILNGQAGGTFGTPPPYEAFNLGGSGTVRGYQQDALAGGKDFLTATAEFRCPVGNLHVKSYHLPLRAIVFFDYGTGLHSESLVYGTPGIARQRPDSGFGYGTGLQMVTPAGLLRFEAGWNAQGVGNVFVNLGDRF